MIQAPSLAWTLGSTLAPGYTLCFGSFIILEVWDPESSQDLIPGRFKERSADLILYWSPYWSLDWNLIWKTDWSLDGSLDWSPDWPSDSSPARFIDWSLDRSTNWSPDWSLDWSPDWPFDSSPDRFTGWSSDWSTSWFPDWYPGWFPEWSTADWLWLVCCCQFIFSDVKLFSKNILILIYSKSHRSLLKCI